MLPRSVVRATGLPADREALRANAVGNPTCWAAAGVTGVSFATTDVVGEVACVAMSVIAARSPSLTAEATWVTKVPGATAGNSRATAGVPYGVVRS